MGIADKIIEEAVLRYSRERDRYLKLAARVADLTRTAIIEESAIRAQVTSRTKSVRSFEEKLRRFAKNPKKQFDTVEQIFAGVGDFAGVRVATYRPEDQKRVEEEICAVFRGPDGGGVVPDPKDNIDFKTARFYRGVHCQVHLPDDELVGDFDNLRDASCEIQICSMMAHVWNEIEHDIAYKPEGAGPGVVEKGMLEALGHLTCSGDAVINRLLDATETRLAEQTGNFLNVHDFVARIRKTYPDVELSVNAGVAFDIAQLLKLATPALITEQLGNGQADLAFARERIGAFNAYLENIGASDLRLNPRSADVLTAALLERHADEILEHFGERGTGRPPRAASLARRYREFLASGGDFGARRDDGHGG